MRAPGAPGHEADMILRLNERITDVFGRVPSRRLFLDSDYQKEHGTASPRLKDHS
jgi:hypothetical protein